MSTRDWPAVLSGREIGRMTIAAGVVLVAASAWAQPVPDADTLLLLQFDRSASADFSVGSPEALAARDAIDPAAGRFGGGADMTDGTRITLVGDDGNFHPPEGTIEFWIKPHWPGNHPETHRLLSCPIGDRKYLNANVLGGGQLGFALATGDGDTWAWNRADAHIADWQPESWHHVAFTWGNGQMRVYVDGTEGRRSETDAPMPADPPEEIIILDGDAVIDALRISKRIYTAEDVERSIVLADKPPYCYLSDVSWTPAEAVVINKRRLLGDVGVPLVLGTTHYPKAIAARSSVRISAKLDEPYKMLVAKAGVCALSSLDARCSFQVWGDGKKLFESPARSASEPPLEIELPISGVGELALITQPAAGRRRSGLGVWTGALVTAGGDVEPLLPSHQLKPARIDMYRRQQTADDYSFSPGEKGSYFVAAKFWEDNIDPDEPPAAEDVGRLLAAFATPGEYEPVNFVIYAIDDLENVSVDVRELRSQTSVLPADAIDVRLVLRRLMRDLYSRPPEQSTVVSRYLLPNQVLDVPGGTLREYHMIVHVPDDAVPGEYRGKVRIAPANQPPFELSMTLEVLPFHLQPLKDRAYGMYYRFPDTKEELPRIEMELADLHAHGCTTLKSNLGIEYELVDGRVVPSFEGLETGLALLVKHGFHGALPVFSGADHAARVLEYDPVADYADRAARERFFSAVKAGMEGLVRLSAQYPQFEFLPTHMDEVFGRQRLERYIRLTEAVRQMPSLRVYITLHNDPNRDVSEMMRQCDPFVDVRCYNGHCMDNWIRAAHTFDDLQGQMAAAGDEAWMYHNIRGSFFQAEWTRLVNGYYMWMSPIRVHVPWMYYSTKGNPFDATDGPPGKGGDFAYAVPDPNDPTQLIPTRHWEAFREGIDDLRYLQTLESLITKHAGGREAEEAKAWLTEVRRSVTPQAGELEPIEEESPLLVWLSRKLDGADYRKIRRQAAEHIRRLTTNKGRGR